MCLWKPRALLYEASLKSISITIIMTQCWESKLNDKQNLVCRDQCVLKRNDLKQNLASLQTLFLPCCWHYQKRGRERNNIWKWKKTTLTGKNNSNLSNLGSQLISPWKIHKKCWEPLQKNSLLTAINSLIAEQPETKQRVQVTFNMVGLHSADMYPHANSYIMGQILSWLKWHHPVDSIRAHLI